MILVAFAVVVSTVALSLMIVDSISEDQFKEFLDRGE
jgi:hypothetical protein